MHCTIYIQIILCKTCTHTLSFTMCQSRSRFPRFGFVYQLNRQFWGVQRVPGLPIRVCARGCNNCVHTRAKMSAINVTKKIQFKRLYLVSGMSTFGPWVNCPYAPTTPTVHTTTISWFPCNFFPRMAPHFLVITIHQVIWQSPGTLGVQLCSTHPRMGGPKWPRLWEVCSDLSWSRDPSAAGVPWYISPKSARISVEILCSMSRDSPSIFLCRFASKFLFTRFR